MFRQVFGAVMNAMAESEETAGSGNDTEVVRKGELVVDEASNRAYADYAEEDDEPPRVPVRKRPKDLQNLHHSLVRFALCLIVPSGHMSHAGGVVRVRRLRLGSLAIRRGAAGFSEPFLLGLISCACRPSTLRRADNVTTRRRNATRITR